MRSVAQEYIDQGVQQGMQQGMQQEKIDIAKSMLKKGLDKKIIQEVTKLNKELIEKLAKV